MGHSNQNVEFRDVSYILAILKHGTLRKAAQQLFISESALSQSLHAVERKWEATLFQKIGRRLVATTTLEKLLPLLHQVHDDGNRLARAIAQFAHPEILSLRLGIVSLARYHAWAAIEQFVDTYGTQVHVEVVEYSTDDVVHHLMAGRLDAGLILRSDNLSNHSLRDVSCSALMKGHLVVVAPDTMPLAPTPTMAYDRLVRLPTVGYPQGYLIQDLLIDVLGEPYEQSIVFTSTLKEWQQLALHLGKGVMVLPDFCIPTMLPNPARYQAIPLAPLIPIELAFATRDDYPPTIVSNLLRSIRATCS